MPPLVKVTWFDAVTCVGWRNESTAPSENTTVGFLVFSNEEYMELAGTYAEDSEMWNNSISIPSCNIITYSVLDENDTDDLEINFEAE